jgi:hypothetical protein
MSIDEDIPIWSIDPCYATKNKNSCIYVDGAMRNKFGNADQSLVDQPSADHSMCHAVAVAEQAIPNDKKRQQQALIRPVTTNRRVQPDLHFLRNGTSNIPFECDGFQFGKVAAGVTKPNMRRSDNDSL